MFPPGFSPFSVRIKPVDPDDLYWIFLLVKLPLVILVPAVLMGAALPVAADVYCRGKRVVGRSLGTVYAANTFGGFLGAAAAGFYLIPQLGYHTSSVLLPAINLGVGALLLFYALKPLAAAFGLAVLTAAAIAGSVYLPKDHFSRKYAQLLPQARLLHHHEGLAATADVFERTDGTRVLFLNGMPEVDTSGLSMATFKMMGALPGLIRSDPQDALMITFGAGVTAGTASRFVDRVDCVDLVTQASEIAGLFARANNRIIHNPKFSMYIDDARHFLQTRRKRYSIIVSDSTHPRAYDSWVLFTAEFYRLVRQRLRENGVFSQWVPFHGLDNQQYRAIIRTFASEFEHTSIWVVGGGYSLLLATPQRLSIDFNAVQKKITSPGIQADLREANIDNVFDVLSHFRCGGERAQNVIAGPGKVITDDHPVHLFFPFKVPVKEQYERWHRENFDLIEKNRESVIPYLTNVGRSDNEREKIQDVLRMMERAR